MAYDEFGIFDNGTPDISRQGVASDMLRGQKPRKQSTSISLAPWAQSTPFTAEDRLPVSRAPQPQRAAASRGTALPRATGSERIAALPPDNLMSDYDKLVAQQADLQAQQAKAWEEPDYESTRRMGRERALGGDSAMLMSLMAQESGEQFKPQSAHYLKQAAAAREPMKVTGGQIMESGEFFQDPGYAKELEAKRIDARLKQTEQQLQHNLTAQERRRLEAQRAQDQKELRQIMIDSQQAIANQASADRRFAAQLASDDRRLRDGAGKIPGNIRKELAEGEGTEATLGTAIETLRESTGMGTGYFQGLVQEKLPGGEALASKLRDEGTRSAIQQLTYVTDGIRHGRFGSALTATEKASAAQYLPSPYDSKERLMEKAEGLRNLVAENNRRVRMEFGREGEPGYGPNGERIPTAPAAGAPRSNAPAPVQQRVGSYYD